MGLEERREKVRKHFLTFICEPCIFLESENLLWCIGHTAVCFSIVNKLLFDHIFIIHIIIWITYFQCQEKISSGFLLFQTTHIPHWKLTMYFSQIYILYYITIAGEILFASYIYLDLPIMWMVGLLDGWHAILTRFWYDVCRQQTASCLWYNARLAALSTCQIH